MTPQVPTKKHFTSRFSKGWPPEAIGKAEMQVKLLSGMLVPVEDGNDADPEAPLEVEGAEDVTAEKPLPAS